jgi:hypothetical protein
MSFSRLPSFDQTIIHLLTLLGVGGGIIALVALIFAVKSWYDGVKMTVELGRVARRVLGRRVQRHSGYQAAEVRSRMGTDVPWRVLKSLALGVPIGFLYCCGGALALLILSFVLGFDVLHHPSRTVDTVFVVVYCCCYIAAVVTAYLNS